MHLILTGATGLVGSGVLDAMIKNKAVTKISVLSRRPVAMAEAARDPRVNVIVHNDFTKYDDALLEQLKDAQGCVWALGISQTQVGKEEYIRITKDYALAAASAFQTLPAESSQLGGRPFNFVFISGYGATFKPGLRTPLFGRVKGETELALAEMRTRRSAFRASTVRPCFVDFTRHEAIKGFIPDQGVTGGAVGSVFFGAVRSAPLRAYSTPTEEFGRFVTDMAMGRFDGDGVEVAGKGVDVLDGGFKVIENWGFRRLAGLDK